MANVRQYMGLSPINGQGGAEPKIGKYIANVTTNIYAGDVVQMQANGRLKVITTTTGSDKIVGVAVHSVVAAAAGTPQDVLVYDDPDQQFKLTDDGDSATPSYAIVGATFALLIPTGNTTTGRSKMEIDASAAGAAATDPILVKGFVEGPGFEIGKYATHRVLLNRHMWKKASAGV